MFTTLARRFYTTKPSSSIPVNNKIVLNRNPRNLEKLRIARKPKGYHLDRLGREYWHTLNFICSNKYITSQIVHNNGSVVVSASTNEWALKKHLYSPRDISAYHNLARVLAQRCLESGISEITSNYYPEEDTKLNEFLTVLQQEGLSLKEPEQFKAPRPWHYSIPQKPWEAISDK